MRKLLLGLFVTAFLSLSCFTSVLAQSVSTGLTKFGSFEGGPDVVNLGNLNVHLTVPIRHKAGRGLNFNYDLSFDSSVWSTDGFHWLPVSGATWGWNPGQTFNSADNAAGQTSYGCWRYNSNGGINGWCTTITNFTYTDMAGAVHALPGTITGNFGVMSDVPGQDASWTYSGFGAAADGSGISATINASTYPQNGPTQPVVQFSVPNLNTTHSTLSGYSQIDQNGNVISFAASGSDSAGIVSVLDGTNTHNDTPYTPGAYTDTLGQTALVVGEINVYNSSSVLTSGALTYAYQDGAGNTSQSLIHYLPYQVTTAFGCSNKSEYSSGVNGNPAAYLPDYILQPDGRRYTFTYEATPGVSGAITGRIASITFPAGGSVSYSYGAPQCDGSVLSLVRTVNDANGTSSIWQYSRTNSNGVWTTVATDPVMNQKVLSFWVGASGAFYETNRTEYAGSVAGGALLRTTATVLSSSEPIEQRQVTTMLPNAAGKSSKVVESYDYLGSPTMVSVYDFGATGAGAGPFLSSKQTNYQPVDNVFDVPAAIIQTSGSGATQTLIVTSYGRDEVAPTASGATQLVAPLTSVRGNITSVTVMGQGPGSTPTTPLITRYTYYDTGLVKTWADPNHTGTTTYSYNQCNSGFPTGTSQTVVPSGVTLTMSASWDCIGGVATSATDVNGNVVSTGHNDSMWRPTSVTDSLGNVTTSVYPTVSSNTSEVSESFNGGASLSDVLTTYDGLGRRILSQVRQGTGATVFNSVAQIYDLLGHGSWTSLPYSAAAGIYQTSGPGTSSLYDALGRTQSVLDSGGASVGYSYSLNDVTVTRGPAASGENAKIRQFEYNGLGEMTSVCEVTAMPGAGSCGQSVAKSGYLTQYSYSGYNLLKVQQNVQTGSSAPQTRTIAYDKIGRKLSEIIPETGTSTYTYDSDSMGTCPGSSPGDVIKAIDNMGNTTCLTYDSLHRPLSSQVVSGTYASVTPQTHIVYDAATLSGTAMQNVKGGLAEAYTCTGSCSAKLTDIFASAYPETSAGQLTGRQVSKMWEATPNSNGYFLTQETSYANGATGVLSASLNGASIGFPNLTFGLDGMGRPKTATDTTNGLNLVTNTNYTLASAIASVTLGNGDADYFGYDSATNRFQTFAALIGGSNPFALSGTLSWNANSSLQNFTLTDASDSSKNQNCGYSMDDLNRLASVNCVGSWAQNFSYDAFGNISKAGPSNPGPGQITQNYMAGYNSVNNQANSGVSASYDANGNQTLAETNNLSWNAAAQPVTVNGVGATYDALGRVVETNASGSYTQYVYRPSGGKAAVVHAGQLVSAVVQLPGGSAAVYNGSGLSYFRHPDWLGSSRIATTWNHAVYSKEAYAPFGETYNEAGTPDRSFAGHDQDTAATNAYDALFRTYDAVAGRWLSPDPSGWDAVQQENPQTLDRYAYAINNPMEYVDPDGLSYSVCGDSGCYHYSDPEYRQIYAQQQTSLSPDYAYRQTQAGPLTIFSFGSGMITATYVDDGNNGPQNLSGPQNTNSVPSTTGPSYPVNRDAELLFCTGDALKEKGVDIGLDILGSIPGLGTAAATSKLGFHLGRELVKELADGAVAFGGGGFAALEGMRGEDARDSMVGSASAATGMGLALADVSLEGTKAIPIVGNFVSAATGFWDLYGAYKSISTCMATGKYR